MAAFPGLPEQAPLLVNIALAAFRPLGQCACPPEQASPSSVIAPGSAGQSAVLAVELPWVQARLPRGRPGMSLHLSEPP